MAEHPALSDFFWGKTGLEDEAPYSGCVALEKRLTEGKTSMSQFKAIMLERAELEKAYGNSLIKMAETASKAKADSSGEMKAAWEALIAGLKKTGLGHVELGKQMSKGCNDKFKEFSKTHSAKRKETIKTLTSAHNARNKAYSSLKSAKTTYDAKYEAHQEAERATQVSHADAKDAEKARLAAFKAAQNQEKSEFAYRQAVSDAEAVRQQFEVQFEQACKTTETLEKERIDRMRRDMWLYSNLASIAAVNDDNANEDIRAALERVDPAREIHAFVASAHTGNVRPVPLQFVTYGQRDPRFDVSNAAQEKAKSVPALAPLPDQKGSQPEAHAMAAAASASAPASAPVDADTYIVVFEYNAQTDAELTLVPGDVVKIVDREEDPWWLGQIDDRKGMVYKDYMEPRKE